MAFWNNQHKQQQQAIDYSNSLLDEMDVAEQNNDMPKIFEISKQHIESCWRMKAAGCTVKYDEHGEPYWSTTK